MKNVFKVIATLLFTCALVTLMLSGTVSAATSLALPTSINGFPVIFVQTSANTPSLAAGQNTTSPTAVKRIITLLDNSSSSMQESANKFSSDIASVRAMLQPGDVIEVYGGDGASEEQFDVNHAANNESWSKNSSIQSYRPALNISNPSPSVSQDQNQNYGYAYFQNNDSGIIGLSAHIAGISDNSFGNCGFLVNGQTNGEDNNDYHYFLQSGQWIFGNGITSWNCWATSVGPDPNNDPQGPYSAVQFNLPYVGGHDYEYDVIYLGGGNSGEFNGNYSAWWLGAEDHTEGGMFDYVIEYYGYGTALNQSNPNTSVFFENHNTNATWNPDAIYVSASEAREYTSSYQWVNLTSATPALAIGGIYPYSPIGVICGTLIQNQTAWWYLPSVPTLQQ